MIYSFIIYTVSIVAIGYFFGRVKKTDSLSYFLGGRKMGPWVTALSAGASSESAWVLMGLSGSAYFLGYQAFWLVPGCLLAYVFNFFILAPRLRHFSEQYNAITVPDVLSVSFHNSKTIRIIASVIIFLTMTTYVVAQLTASGKAFNAIFNLEYWQGVIIGISIILLYTYTGGFRASSITDSIQASFMAISMIGIPFYALIKVGGVNQLHISLTALDSKLTSFYSNEIGLNAFLIAIGWLSISLAYPGLVHQLTRFMAIEDPKELKRSGIIGSTWATIIFTGSIVFGLCARLLISEVADTEQILPLFTSTNLTPILSGFVLAAIVSAIASTADSQLVVATSALSHDIFKKLLVEPWGETNSSSRPVYLTFAPIRALIEWVYKNTANNDEVEDKVNKLNKYILLALGIVATLFAVSENRVIFHFVLYAWAGLGAAFGPPMIALLFWKKVTRIGISSGMLAGFAMTIFWKEMGYGSSIIYEIIPALIVSITLTFGISLIEGRKER